MAFVDLQFVDRQKLTISSRPFDCSICLAVNDRISKLRRCDEDRYDFSAEDDVIFPIQIEKGGVKHGFCPAKATWDFKVQNIYNLLILSCETGALYNKGGLVNQPFWFIDIMSWFAPAYDNLKFMSRAKSILGEGSNKQQSLGVRNGSNQRRSTSQGRSAIKGSR